MCHFNSVVVEIQTLAVSFSARGSDNASCPYRWSPLLQQLNTLFWARGLALHWGIVIVFFPCVCFYVRFIFHFLDNQWSSSSVVCSPPMYPDDHNLKTATTRAKSIFQTCLPASFVATAGGTRRDNPFPQPIPNSKIYPIPTPSVSCPCRERGVKRRQKGYNWAQEGTLPYIRKKRHTRRIGDLQPNGPICCTPCCYSSTLLRLFVGY